MPHKKLTIEDYEITETGQVINKTNNHILKPQPNGKGYLRVKIDGKLRFVHRLVAEKYIPNPNNYEQVNHIDGNRLNNNVTNLEWVTNQQNRDHAIKNHLPTSIEDRNFSKLNWEKVEYIRSHFPEKPISYFAELYGVTERTIKNVINFKTWIKK